MGFQVQLHKFNRSEASLMIQKIEELNANHQCHGILIQSPVEFEEDSVSTEYFLDLVLPEKDVDGLSRTSLAALSTPLSKNTDKIQISFEPCTPKGILSLLKHYNVELKERRVAILGRSRIVGLPLAHLLLSRSDATVTVCHSHTLESHLAEITRQSDIVISAVGKADLIKESMVSNHTILVDVGINRTKDGDIVGDASLGARERVSAYTPVPGGVGPMTVASLVDNVFRSAKYHYESYGRKE